MRKIKKGRARPTALYPLAIRPTRLPLGAKAPHGAYLKKEYTIFLIGV